MILAGTLLVGVLLGVVAATRGPAVVAPYLPRSASGHNERLDGQVVRKQRDGNRLLVKITTPQGPMLITFTEKVADLDVLLDPGDTVTVKTAAGYATFVDDPILERVQRPSGAGPSTSPAPLAAPSEGSPQKPTQ